jgi:hypothetical protein
MKAGMYDELVPVDVYPLSIDGNRSNRIRGSIHTSKHGLLVMSLRQMDSNCFPAMDSKSLEGFTVAGAENVDTDFYDYEERD